MESPAAPELTCCDWLILPGVRMLTVPLGALTAPEMLRLSVPSTTVSPPPLVESVPMPMKLLPVLDRLITPELLPPLSRPAAMLVPTCWLTLPVMLFRLRPPVSAEMEPSVVLAALVSWIDPRELTVPWPRFITPPPALSETPLLA